MIDNVRVESIGGRMICTNHLLHKWPDLSQLPPDSGEGMTVSFTYRRCRILSELLGTAPSAFQRAYTPSPSPILGIDTDNGGELLNEAVVTYCE